MVEQQIIKAFMLDRVLWEGYYRFVSLDFVRTNYTLLYKLFISLNSYYETYAEVDQCTKLSIEAQYLTLYPVLKEADRKEMSIVLDIIEVCEVNTSAIVALLETHKTKSLASQIALTALDVCENRKTVEELVNLTNMLGEPIGLDSSDEFETLTTDIESLATLEEQESGLHWRLTGLNKSLGQLRKGNMGHIFARIECLAKGTRVMLADGRNWPVEALKAGMKVMGSDSLPRSILATTKGTQPMYRIEYNFGEYYDCNEGHILQLRAEGETEVSVPVREYLKWSDKMKARFKQYKVGIELPEKEVKVDPYVLGLWLGDGTSAKSEFTNADIEIIDSLKGYADKVGLECKILIYPNQGKAVTIRFCQKEQGIGKNKFIQFLKEHRLFKNKHIPDNYLRNNRFNRLELLAGLIDSDGWREKYGMGFCNRNEGMVDQVIWLCRSVGLHATKRGKPVKGVMYWNVGIYGDCSVIPCRVPRKQYSKPTKPPKRKGLNFGFSVKPIGEGEYYGIQVDGDSLYLLNDFTVTHNCGKTAMWISESTYMLPQLKDNQQLCIFFNEEDGKAIVWRMYSAVLHWEYPQILANPQEAKRLFYKAIGGEDRIRFYDRPTLSKKFVERALEQSNAGLIVIDNMDKVTGFEADRKDLQLANCYKWGRELSKTYAPILTVGQADATADNSMWISESQMADGKTGKPSETDFTIGIGRTDTSQHPHERFIHISRNKLRGDKNTLEGLRHAKFSTILEPTYSIYKDGGTHAIL